MSVLSQLHNMVGKNEKILWSGRPMKKCFILESIFNSLLPFALIWALVDGGIIFAAGMGFAQADVPVKDAVKATWPLIFFLTLHLMPVWIYLGGVIFSFLRYKNASFIITDKGVYISSGLFSLNFNHKPFMEIARVNLHRGIIDRMLGVGDVVFGAAINLPNTPEAVNNYVSNQLSDKLSIYDIPDYDQVYSLVKQLQQNIYSDVQYPNDLRPKENRGYNTTYVPPENKQ